MSHQYDSLIVLTTGKQDRGARATLAFSWACSALALGKRTAMFLTMDGTVWGIEGSAATVQVQGFEPLSNYIETFRGLGGVVLVCAPCTEYYCSHARAGEAVPLLDGAELAGLATVVSAAGPNCTVVTF
jgi:predicted peroxiredoxin